MEASPETDPTGTGTDPTNTAKLIALTGIEQAEAAFASALDGIDFGLLTDTDSVAVMAAVEGIGRHVDAARVRSAATIGDRSRSGLGHESLAWRLGCRNSHDLICRLTRISGAEVSRRMRLGGFISERVVGATALPPLYPAVAAGLESGELGVDAAEAIVTALAQIAERCAPDDLLTAERALVASATGAITQETEGLPGAGLAFPADIVRGQAQEWKARLDPDGVAPCEPVLEPKSNIGFGLLRQGVYPLRGAVTPELRGIINVIFDAHISARATPAFPTAAEQAAIDAGELVPGAEVATDDRSGGEKRADILRAVFESASRDPGTPRMGGAAPTVMVHVNAVDLLDGRGVGWADGVEAPLSLKTVQQMICSGGYRKVVFGQSGEILHLGAKQRFFSAGQRAAIAARDGGCVIPGCTVTAHLSEVHHVVNWQHGGRTDIENGVLLCWYHHHSIDTSGWQIRMIRGKPEIKAPVWIDATRSWRPAAKHRATRCGPPVRKAAPVAC